MMKKPSRKEVIARRKRLLLTQIQQQRIDLSHGTQEWLDVTEPYDKAWRVFVSLKPVLLVGASLASLYSIKHPKKLMRWGKRAIGTFGLIRALQKSFKKTTN